MLVRRLRSKTVRPHTTRFFFCEWLAYRSFRTAIEDELQVLYDAYYEDLEQYALYQQQYLSSNRTIPPPPGPGPFPGSVEVDRYGAVVAGAAPPRRASS